MKTANRKEGSPYRIIYLLFIFFLICFSVCEGRQHSCSEYGQFAFLPCRDTVYLSNREKYLVPLFGHSCYDIELSSDWPIDAYLFDLLDLEESEGKTRRKSGARNTIKKGEGIERFSLCKNSTSCLVERDHLNRHGQFNLLVSRTRTKNENHEELSQEIDDIRQRLVLSIEHCDALPSSWYLSLMGVAFAGFLSAIMCLCVVGEYLSGLRTVTKLRRKLQKLQFVELTQIAPSKNEKEKCFNDSEKVESNRIAV